MGKAVRQTALDPKVGMTGYELYQFIQDAERHGVDLGSTVKVNVNWHSGIRTIEIADK